MNKIKNPNWLNRKKINLKFFENLKQEKISRMLMIKLPKLREK